MDSSIEQLITDYRLLKQDRDVIDGRMKVLRESIEGKVTESGDWKDDDGYARFAKYEAGFKMTAGDVKGLVELVGGPSTADSDNIGIWENSPSATVRRCAEVVREFVSLSESRKTLQVK